MIKFFRTIRQRMLKENRFSRYFLYAIGEIVLVVIGILIALQVNNWNNDRLARSEARDYMTALLGESRQNARILEGLALSNRAALKAANRLMAVLDAPPAALDMDSVHADLAKTMTIGTTAITANIYREMESSGKLKLLKDDSLRRAIVDFYGSIDLVYKLEEIGVTDQWKDLYTPFVNKHLDNNRILSYWVPPAETGVHVTTRSALPFWDLPPTDPLKIEMGNLLATYYAGVWWVAGQQEVLLARTREIERQLRKGLGLSGEATHEAPLSTFDR